MRSIILAATLIVLPAAAAQAIEPVPDEERFQLERQGDSIVRLDRKTGAMSICTTEGLTLDCRMSSDERAALQEEIDRLAAENEQLRAAGAGDAPQAGISKDGKELTLKLPTEEDIKGAVAFLEDVLRRFVAAIKDLAGPV